MYKIYRFMRSNPGKAFIVATLGIIAIAAIVLLRSPGSSSVTALQSTPTPYPEQTWQIDRSLTIGDFTVHLHRITDTADGLRVDESYQTSVSELNYLPIGSTDIQYADGSVAEARGAQLPMPGEQVNMSLGAFLVVDNTLSGSVKIPMASVSEDGTLSPEPQLMVKDRQYAITKFVLQQGQLDVVARPINDAAKRSTLGVAAAEPVETLLTDDLGRTFTSFSGSMAFDPFTQELTEQIFQFDQMQRDHLSSATMFTLTIRSGGEIVGPFVFGSVGLVSEDITPSGTPESPGDVSPGDPIPTPPNVND